MYFLWIPLYPRVEFYLIVFIHIYFYVISKKFPSVTLRNKNVTKTLFSNQM